MSDFIPIIHIPKGYELDNTVRVDKGICLSVVRALESSGFLLITTDLLDSDLQTKALKVTKSFFEKGFSDHIISHPIDPKVYVMLNTPADCLDVDPTIQEYMIVMKLIKKALLRIIAFGIGLEDINYFVKLHDEDNDALRLINYSQGDQDTGNRCKEHSDYGTITLLSIDGVSGLEAFHNGTWTPVPYQKGSIIVNIGSLLNSWTNGKLLATLHRVAGPASKNSGSKKEVLIEAVKQSRTSIAFFADPNKDVIVSLTESQFPGECSRSMSVSQYIQWRSGGTISNRSGVGFTDEEKQRL